MNPRAAIASACVAVYPFDVVDEVTIGDRSTALRARAPGIIAGRRDPEHVAQDRHWIVGAAIFDKTESHFGAPAKIAIDFLKCRAPCAAARSLAQTGDLCRVVRRRQRRLPCGAPRRRRRLQPGPTLLHPAP